MKKNEFYRDFSNRKPFNNIPCKENEELVPVIINDEMKVTLKYSGLDWDNVESWHFPHAKQLVPVAFIPNEKGQMDSYMKWFNNEVERYLKHNPDSETDVLSLDEFLKNINDEDGNGFDPTGTTENEDQALLTMTINLLIEDLAQQDVKMSQIFSLLIDGYQKKEILNKVKLGKGKTQGYAFIKKTQKIAKELYYMNYRD